MVIAYLRVSTEKQLLENQRNEIARFAENKGAILGRPKGSNKQTRLLIDNEENIREMIAQGIRKIDIAKHYQVSKATLYGS